jgi:hypothetical protein
MSVAKSKRSGSSRSSSGGSNVKARDRSRKIKQFILLGIYAFIMLVSVRRMMQDQLLGSFYMDLAAFALLWLYYALSVAKITKLIKIKSQWFYAHLLVVVVHLLVAVFFNEPSPDSQIQSNQAIKDLPKSEPVVQPYQVGEE